MLKEWIKLGKINTYKIRNKNGWMQKNRIIEYLKAI